VSRVLVTGGAGFIGSHLIDRYLERGWDVVALDDLSSGRESNLARALRNPNFRLVVGDVRDEAVVAELVRSADLVLHMAARVGLKLVVQSAVETLGANVDGTQMVLRQAVRYGRKIVVASTSEVYGLATKFPSSEEDPITIGSPTKSRWSYALSKALDESAALAHYREDGLPAIVVRLFNTVGPRQTAHYGMVIPRFVRQALAGEPLTVYGDGTQTRCFGYVGDIVNGIVALTDEPKALGQVINLGNPQETRILDLAQRILTLTASRSPLEFVPYDRAYEANFEEIYRRVPDIAKARELIGFAPRMGLGDILAAVVEEQSQAPPRAVPA